MALPFPLLMTPDGDLKPFDLDNNGMLVRVYPPYQAVLEASDVDFLSEVPSFDLVKRLAPQTPPRPLGAVSIDGQPAVQANALQIDFIKPEFDRAPSSEINRGDPPTPLLFEVANLVLARIRTATRAPFLKPINWDRALWHLRYLTDKGEELEHNPALIRGRVATTMSISFAGLNDTIWEQVKSLTPARTMRTWESLFLDAEALLPDIGPSIVLAAAALETMIVYSLEKFAEDKTSPPGLWEWINHRTDIRTKPSVEEQFDQLLKLFAGTSLKESQSLWTAFKNLKSARNKFVHEGLASLGGKEVDRATAIKLIAGAKDVAAWLENLLPEDLRRPVPAVMNFQFTKMLIGSEAPSPGA